MPTNRWLTVTTETIGALVLILFFAALGASGTSYLGEVDAISFTKTLHLMWQLVHDIVHGQHLRAQFWGISAGQIWDTIRLVLVSCLMALAVGLIFTWLRLISLSRKATQAVSSCVFTVLESIPDTMYVVLIVMLVVHLADYNNIELPVFNVGNPTLADTFIPAFALCLPGALFLQRVLFSKVRDERFADYATTALAKGASPRRVLLGHVMPNLGPMLLRQIPIVVGLVLSGALFTEYFFEYSGALFNFTNWATGYDFSTGIPPVDLNWVRDINGGSLQDIVSGASALGVSKPTGIPHYQVGLVFLIGGLLVLLWAVGRIISETWYSAKYGTLTELPAPRYERHRVHLLPLVSGSVLFAAILLLGAFPATLTGHQPALSYNQMAQYISLGNTFASPPSAAYPLGTDTFGRDLLSLTLYGTYYTLWPVAVITGLVWVFSMIVATFTFAWPNTILQKLVRYVGRCLSGIPVLMVVFLALYQGDLFTSNKLLHYILWITLFEVGHGSYTLWTGMDEWRRFRFTEGAFSLGRRNFAILFTHFRSWLGYFTLEFIFSEFARVLSLMVQLAAFHVFMVSEVGYLAYVPGKQGVIPAHTSWMNMIGQSTGALAYIDQPYSLYAPVLALVVVMVAVNLIARGLRGKDRVRSA